MIDPLRWPSAVLDDLVDGAPDELLVRYREAHAGPPSKISLSEIANMALFLCTKAGERITGQAIPVDADVRYLV